LAKAAPRASCDPGWSVRGLGVLPAEGQADLRLEPGRPEAGTLGRRTGARAWPARVEFDFKYDGLGFATLAFNNMSGVGRSGTGVLKVDGQVVANQRVERTLPLILQWDETFDVGADTGTPVDDKDYQIPFKFTGKLNKLTIAVDRPKLTAEDERRLQEAASRAADGPGTTGQR
jgi:hypothetical protein